MLDELIAKM